MSLIVVSNRVARPDAEEPVEGGLAAALLPAVRTSGAIWVGSSGRLTESSERDCLARVEALGTGALAMVDLPKAHYSGFYEGFANSALWPALHSRTDLIRATGSDLASYRAVNNFMARALVRFAKPDSSFWIHDYHFLPLGAELRRCGITQPIGFFLHTPFPARDVMVSVPHHAELMRALLACDLIGFQTEDDLTNFSDYLVRELGLAVHNHTVVTEHGETRLASFPIGIDGRAFAERATKAAARPEVSRLRSSLEGARLIIGVDRIDYSKGLTNRFQAIDRLLQNQPELARQVVLLQIAMPSRCRIEAYRALQAELAGLVGEINGRRGEVDWTPIRYLCKGFPQSVLAGYYRVARVGLVTSLHDGMNLVAKEYIAAQNPLDPGMLVLSRFAGAARQLDAAVLVNPNDIDAVVRGISIAIAMSAEERRERWRAMMQTLQDSSLANWFSGFVEALAACRQPRRLIARPDAALLPFRPRRADAAVSQGA